MTWVLCSRHGKKSVLLEYTLGAIKHTPQHRKTYQISISSSTESSKASSDMSKQCSCTAVSHSDISSVLGKIVNRASGKGPSLSMCSSASEGSESFLWKALLQDKLNFDPKPDVSLTNWISYVELTAPTGRKVVSKAAMKIIQSLNANEKSPLEVGKMKLTVPDAVYVLTNVKAVSSAYVFYIWLRKQFYYIPHADIYGALLQRLTEGNPTTDTWNKLHYVMEDMVWKKIPLDDKHFQRLLQIGCVSGTKLPCTTIRMQWYIDWFMKMREIGFSPSPCTFEKLMKLCNKLEMYESTLSIFRNIDVNTHLWSFKLALNACRKMNNLPLAEKILNEMKQKGIKPGAKCYTSILGLYADHGFIEKAETLFEEMKCDYALDIPAYTSMIHAYVRGGMVKQAERVFRSIPVALDAGIYRAMAACYRDAGCFRELFTIIDDAKRHKICLGPTCYESSFNVCVEKQEWRYAIDLVKDMWARGMSPSPKLFCKLLHACNMVNDFRVCKNFALDILKVELQSCEDFQIAIKMYASIDMFGYSRDVLNLMKIQGYLPSLEFYEEMIMLVMKKSLLDAMNIFHEMRSANHVPSLSVYSSLISENIKSGNLSQGRKIYANLLEAGLQPDMQEYPFCMLQ